MSALSELDSLPFPVFTTASGIEVQSSAVEVREGKLKARCHRRSTGGWHGWLIIRNLSPVNVAAREICSRLSVH